MNNLKDIEIVLFEHSVSSIVNSKSTELDIMKETIVSFSRLHFYLYLIFSIVICAVGLVIYLNADVSYLVGISILAIMVFLSVFLLFEAFSKRLKKKIIISIKGIKSYEKTITWDQVSKIQILEIRPAERRLSFEQIRIFIDNQGIGNSIKIDMTELNIKKDNFIVKLLFYWKEATS